MASAHLFLETRVGGFLRSISYKNTKNNSNCKITPSFWNIRLGITFLLFLWQLFFAGAAFAQTELITNGSFSSGFSGWTQNGTAWAGTSLSNYHTYPGYAALGVDNNGYPKENADGAFHQTISIPANATAATLSFWYYITTHETGYAVNDKLFVSIRDSYGNFIAYTAILSNVNKTTGYVQKTFDLSYYKGQTIQVRFGAVTNSSNTTTFRIDDVSVIADIPLLAPAKITIAPSSLSFGRVQVGSCSTASLAIQHVLNTRAVTGTVSAVSPYSITTNSSFSLSGSAGVNVGIKFCPSSSGTFSGSALISSGAIKNISAVSLNGIGFIPAPTTGAIQINAMLDGNSWSGTVNYGLSGQQSLNGNNVPADFQNKPQGSYRLTYYSGGPVGAKFSSITPSSSQALSGGGHTVFTLNFSSPPRLTPTATTGTCQVNGSTSALLFGTVNPNGTSTTAWFQWGISTAYGNLTVTKNVGNGTSAVQVMPQISGLLSNTIYNFRIVGRNSAGTKYGTNLTCTTPPPAVIPPRASTGAATSVASSSAILNGTINSNGAPTKGWFEWGTSATYGNNTPPLLSGSRGTNPVPISVSISGLVPKTSYYFRTVGQNSAGSSYGNGHTFTTAASNNTPPALVVNGINNNYSTTSFPYKHFINLTGTGLNSITRISWICTQPNGVSCGVITPWTSANWAGKFARTSDTAGWITPTLLDGSGGPTGTYNWKVTFSGAGQSVSRNFTVSYNPANNSALPGAFVLSNNPPYCDTNYSSPAVRLNWIPSKGATSYDVYRNGNLYTHVLTSRTFLNTGTNMVAGQTYRYFVKATNTNGSVTSNTITVSVASKVCNSAPKSLLPPTLLSPANGAINQPTALTLSWKAVTNGTEYRYQISKTPTFSTDSTGRNCYNCVKNDWVQNFTRYYLSGLERGSRYYWRVRAGNYANGLTSSWSATRSFTTQTQALSAPAGLIANPGSNYMSLTWQDTKNEAGYKIQRRVGASNSWREVGATGQNVFFFKDTNVVAGTTYYYRVYAYGTSANTSAYSNVASATINAVTPSVSWITPPPATITNGQTYSLAWNVLAGGNKTHSNVHWDTNPARLKTSSAQHSTAGSSFVAPSANTWYFVAHAVVGGKDYWSPVQTVTVNSSCAAPGATMQLVQGIDKTGCLEAGKQQKYRINVRSGTAYIITLTPLRGDPDFYLATSETCLAQVPGSNSCYLDMRTSATTLPESIQKIASVTGAYYVAVYGSSNTKYKIRVDSARPEAVIDADNNAPQIGDLVKFTAAKSLRSSSSCKINSYRWDFGDHMLGTGVNETHVFKTANNGVSYTVKLTVGDTCGGRDTATMSVAVSAKTAGCGNLQSCSKDPVNLATGNYTYEQSDLSIPGIGIPFKFNRSYNSKDAQLRNGPLGYGWVFSYGMNLEKASAARVVVFGDGNREVYRDNNDGTFSPDPGIHNTLVHNANGTFTLITKQQLKYNFDSKDRLASIVDKNKNTLLINYGASSNLESITDTAGRKIRFAYNAGHLIKITDPVGRTVKFGYNSNGDLTSAMDPNGGITQYIYDLNHQLTKIIDPGNNTIVNNIYDKAGMRRVVETQKDALGNPTGFKYNFETGVTTVTDAFGNKTYYYHDKRMRVSSIKDARGNTQYFNYDNNGNRTEVIDKNGNATSYHYDSHGNVTSKTESLGNTTTITYYADNNPEQRINALGNATNFTYDINGNLIEAMDALGNITRVDYYNNGLPGTVTDAEGNTTVNTYDTRGDLVKSKDALGNITRYTYDGVGRRKTKIDALGRTTTYTYDNDNNLLSLKNPTGKLVSYRYNKNNNRERVTDRRNNATNYIYDKRGHLTVTTDPYGKTNRTNYDALNRKKSVTDKKGNATHYSYDSVGNLASVKDALNNVTNYTYDANGNRVKVTDPVGNAIRYFYDAINQRIRVRDALGDTTRIVYDELGRKFSVTNAKHQTTTFTYDKLGRLKIVTDATGATVQYGYDKNGNRISMTNANGNITVYHYDKLNRLLTKIEPKGSTTRYTYNAVGDLKKLVRPNGDVIQYDYDNLDRLITITYPDAGTVSFKYDNNGNRIHLMDALGTQTYTYDKLNRMTVHTDPFGRTVGYGYDANGNRKVLTYPGNKTVNYAYDKLNRLKTVTDWLTNTTNYNYDAAGKLETTDLPDGTTANYGYDKANRLTSLSNKKANGGIISSYSYTLDAIGNHKAEQRNDPLIPVLTPGTIIYHYDVENRLTDANGIANKFSPNGNMTDKGNSRYNYDYENRLIQTVIGGITTRYQYDGLGDRYTRTRGGVTTRFILDTNTRLTNLLAETDAGNKITAYNIYGLGLIARIRPNGSASYYHYDSRGSTIALTDSSGTVTDTYAYDPFGKPVNRTGSTINPFTYIGSYGVIDEGDDLFYIRARYYDSEQQRFISKDTKKGDKRDGQSLNRYIYAMNSPAILIDISGYKPQTGSSDYAPLSSYLIGDQAIQLTNSQWNTAGTTPRSISRGAIMLPSKPNTFVKFKYCLGVFCEGRIFGRDSAGRGYFSSQLVAGFGFGAEFGGGNDFSVEEGSTQNVGLVEAKLSSGSATIGASADMQVRKNGRTDFGLRTSIRGGYGPVYVEVDNDGKREVGAGLLAGIGIYGNDQTFVYSDEAAFRSLWEDIGF